MQRAPVHPARTLAHSHTHTHLALCGRVCLLILAALVVGRIHAVALLCRGRLGGRALGSADVGHEPRRRPAVPSLSLSLSLSVPVPIPVTVTVSVSVSVSVPTRSAPSPEPVVPLSSVLAAVASVDEPPGVVARPSPHAHAATTTSAAPAPAPKVPVLIPTPPLHFARPRSGDTRGKLRKLASVPKPSSFPHHNPTSAVQWESKSSISDKRAFRNRGGKLGLLLHIPIVHRSAPATTRPAATQTLELQ